MKQNTNFIPTLVHTNLSFASKNHVEKIYRRNAISEILILEKEFRTQAIVTKQTRSEGEKYESLTSLLSLNEEVKRYKETE